MSNSLIKNFAVLGTGSAVSMLLGFFTTPILTRLVEPGVYGEYALFVVYGSIALAVVSLGLDQALLRFFYKSEEVSYRSNLLKFCFGLPLAVTIGFSTLALGVLLLLDNWLHIPFVNAEKVLLFIVYALALVVNRFSSVLIRLLHDAKLYSKTMILNKASFAGIAISLLLMFQGNNGFAVLAFSLVISTALVTVIQIRSQWKIWHFSSANRVEIPSRRRLIEYGLPFVVSATLSMALSATGRILLGFLGNDAEVGIFAAGISLAGVFSIIQSTFNILWTPLMVEHNESDPDDHRFYILAHQGVAFAMMAFGLTVILFKDVIVALLGESYQSAACIFPLLCFNPIFYTMSETTINGSIIKEKSFAHVWTSAAACAANVMVCLALIPIFGMRGAAMGTAVGYMVFFVVRSALSHQVMPISYGYGKVLVSTLLLTVFAIWNTFFSFQWSMLVYYAVSLTIIVVIYKSTLVVFIKKLHPFDGGARG